ncbi:hypothetical protein GcM3_009010 [Golovinomyces cichoracearum]|uniref:Uncharacterized protein n=1 Tax=Golovinomyces cichoracearum TaxID=62708 RepID=A0A420JAB3_9PEZI|nr:hypothetical protein GcM3_009010 [Golovinomyces cichoracearum]
MPTTLNGEAQPGSSRGGKSGLFDFHAITLDWSDGIVVCHLGRSPK